MLQGHLKNGFKKDSVAFNVKNPEWRLNPKAKHRMHAVIIILAADDVYGNDDYLERLKVFREEFNELDYKPVVVLSRVDNIDSTLTNSPAGVYKSEKVQACLLELSSKSGFPLAHIYPCKLYSNEQERSKDVETMAMISFTEALHRAVSAIEEEENKADTSSDDELKSGKSRKSTHKKGGKKQPPLSDSEDENEKKVSPKKSKSKMKSKTGGSGGGGGGGDSSNDEEMESDPRASSKGKQSKSAKKNKETGEHSAMETEPKPKNGGGKSSGAPGGSSGETGGEEEEEEDEFDKKLAALQAQMSALVMAKKKSKARDI